MLDGKQILSSKTYDPTPIWYLLVRVSGRLGRLISVFINVLSNHSRRYPLLYPVYLSIRLVCITVRWVGDESFLPVRFYTTLLHDTSSLL